MGLASSSKNLSLIHPDNEMLLLPGSSQILGSGVGDGKPITEGKGSDVSEAAAGVDEEEEKEFRLELSSTKSMSIAE